MGEKILFLDMDGPLRSGRCYFGESLIYYGDRDFERLDPLALDCVKRIVAKTGCKIVMNTTFNKHDEAHMTKLFELNGYREWSEHIHRYWKTKYPLTMNREEGIVDWLRCAEHRGEEISHFVIADDFADAFPTLHDNLVHVEFDEGLGVKHYRKIIERFGCRDTFILPF
jgi:hypothetical protein